MHHLVDAQLCCRTKTVLDGTYNAVHIMLVTLKLQHRINHVFQYLGTGYRTLFIDVSNHNDRRVRLLRKLQQHRRTLTNLRHTARRRLHRFRRHRLNRVNHHQIRPHSLDVLKHRLNHRLTHHKDIRGLRTRIMVKVRVRVQIYPIRSQLQLARTLLPTHI